MLCPCHLRTSSLPRWVLSLGPCFPTVLVVVVVVVVLIVVFAVVLVVVVKRAETIKLQIRG